MTVSTSDITSGPYTGNGALDEYSYDFTVQNKAHLEVFETTDAGVRTTLTVDVDYTVNDVGVDGGGTITRLAGNLPTDYIWYVRAAYPEDQETDFTALGPFSPSIHELQFDHLTYLVKQLSDKLGRALTFTKELVAPVGVDVTLPQPVAGAIAAMWNSAGTALEIGPTADEVSNAQGYATSAAASAAAAAISYDNFDDRYLGEKSSDPTLDNDGDTLLTGAIYFNNSTNVMRVYNGASWGDIGTAQNSASSVNIGDINHRFVAEEVDAALQELGAATIYRNQIGGVALTNAGSGYAVTDKVYIEGTNVFYTVNAVDGSGAITSSSTSIVDKRTHGEAGVYSSTTDGSGTGAEFTLSSITLNTVEVDETQTLTNKDLTDCTANTQTVGDDSTKIATTEYADANGWKLLSEQSTPSGANGEYLILTDIPAGYRKYQLIIANVIPDVDNEVFRIELSNNNGSSYYAAGYVSRWASRAANSTTVTEFNSTSTTALIAMGNNDAGSSQGLNGEVTFYNLTIAKYSIADFTLITETDTTLLTSLSGVGRLDQNQIIDAMRISMTTGGADGIASGSIQLLGLK